jgi:hypothetical protein
MKKFLKYFAGSLAFVGLTTVICWVPKGHKALKFKYLNGLDNKIYDSGIHLINPFTQVNYN